MARWKQAVTDIISLQAVTCALGEADRMNHPGERAVALDLAELRIRESTERLHRLWAGDPLPGPLVELIADARTALRSARSAGIEWTVAADRLVAEHPALLVEELLAAGFDGLLLVPAPGIPLFRGSPAVFLSQQTGHAPDQRFRSFIESFGPFSGVLSAWSRSTAGPRQVYRQFDFGIGRAVRDLVIPLEAGLPGGQPLLVIAIEKGQERPVALPPRRPADQPPLPIVFADSLDEP